MKRNERGFTLVELLVVIGIIALLISVLLPALGKAREQANTVACAANMRSISQAVSIYQAENKGYFPPSGSPDVSGTTLGSHWNGHIWTRLKLPAGGNVRTCPTTLALLPNTTLTPANFQDPTTKAFAGAFASYKYNFILGGLETATINTANPPRVDPVSGRWNATPYKTVRDSTNMALFVESAFLYKVYTAYGDYANDRGGRSSRLRFANIASSSLAKTIDGIPRQICIEISPVHNRKPTSALNKTIATTFQAMQGSVNVAFCDGSVRNMPFRQGENGLSTTANAGQPSDLGEGVDNGIGLAHCQSFIPEVKFTPIHP